MGFVKFEIQDINGDSCPDLEKGIEEVAQAAMMASREVLLAGGDVNKASVPRRRGLRVAATTKPRDVNAGRSRRSRLSKRAPGMRPRRPVLPITPRAVLASAPLFVLFVAAPVVASGTGSGTVSAEEGTWELARGRGNRASQRLVDEGLVVVLLLARSKRRDVRLPPPPQLIMDEKGLVLLFAFGTPGCSYENNNLHAIRVAMIISKNSRSRYRRSTAVGIATGPIWAGLLGNPLFRCGAFPGVWRELLSVFSLIGSRLGPGR